MRIGIDLLGGDAPPLDLFEAILSLRSELPKSCSLLLFTTPDLTHGFRSRITPEPGVNIELEEVSQVIEMGDSPLTAVRRKRGSSMAVGLKMVRDGRLDALVSTGNTGALVASATLTLPLLPGVERPGLLASIPSISGHVAVIDIGANLYPKTHHLWQFARMGAAYQRCTEQIARPKIGLLNIGTEEMKGTKGIQEAYQYLVEKLRHSDTPFVGNIEGKDAFTGLVDVIISDGFTGNVFLKTAEGISLFILQYLRKAFEAVLTPDVERVLESLNQRVNYSEYPGALVCGVEGVVVKCHGYSDQQAVASGVKGAIRLIEGNLIGKMKEALS
ncbi:MAG: phosphate acyltransferase PlsX [Parachlamydiales bacterium]